MRLRDLTLIVLRLIAVWLGCWTVIRSEFLLIGYLPFALPATYIPIQLTIHAMQILIAAGLFLASPRLADWICRDAADGPLSSAPGAGDLYHIACFVMGLWMLVQAIQPGAQALGSLISRGNATLLLDTQTVVGLCHSGILVLFGLALIFGSRGLSRFLASLGHDPDNVPAQQFSLKLLVALVTASALLLLTMRLLILG
jgi:hypothetical protein